MRVARSRRSAGRGRPCSSRRAGRAPAPATTSRRRRRACTAGVPTKPSTSTLGLDVVGVGDLDLDADVQERLGSGSSNDPDDRRRVALVDDLVEADVAEPAGLLADRPLKPRPGRVVVRVWRAVRLRRRRSGRSAYRADGSSGRRDRTPQRAWQAIRRSGARSAVSVRKGSFPAGEDSEPPHPSATAIAVLFEHSPKAVPVAADTHLRLLSGVGDIT